MKTIKKVHGFTLIEVMVVVVVVTILAVIAIPSYEQYVRRSNLAAAKQEILKLAQLLERHRGKNFTYKGFDPSNQYQSPDDASQIYFNAETGKLSLPLGATGSAVKYVIEVLDTNALKPLSAIETTNSSGNTIIGQNWVIRAESTDPQNATLLMSSNGLRCQNNAKENVTYKTCGATSSGSETW